MKPIDIILVALVVVAVVFALRRTILAAKSGKCSGCNCGSDEKSCCCSTKK